MRTAGITSKGSEFHWRWSPTPEQRLLAHGSDEPKPLAPSPPAAVEAREAFEPTRDKSLPAEVRNDAPGKGPDTSPATASSVKTEPAPPPAARSADWPGFRGPNRDGVIRGTQIDTDWSTSPPVAIWRRPVGPGWSSFAVQGDLLYTQEQRGEDEIVASYRVATGEPVWRHRNPVRFWESNGGAGPRGTPTISNGRVFALGATGILNALDAGSGVVLWSRNVATDAGVELPGWGFASSPLVLDNVVIVAVSGQLVGYDARTGDPRWFGPKGGSGYSSPHLVTIDGVPQVILLRGSRTISVAPADGSLLWEHIWQLGVGIVQPAQVPNGDVLISVGDAMGGLGMRLLSIAKRPEGWNVEDRWTSRGLKPYFNDFVVHQGHAFGFDGSILACISLEDGARKWKGGRYGNGQLVLLAEQNTLLVLSEEGELALVEASPDKFTELARIPAIDGKTWNHPVVVGDVLLARNGQEMAAFRLPRASR
jgi:outer membrane protein assembly factor BamB